VYESSAHTGFATSGQFAINSEYAVTYAASDFDVALSPIFRRSGRTLLTLIGGIPVKSPSVSKDRSLVSSIPICSMRSRKMVALGWSNAPPSGAQTRSKINFWSKGFRR